MICHLCACRGLGALRGAKNFQGGAAPVLAAAEAAQRDKALRPLRERLRPGRRKDLNVESER